MFCINIFSSYECWSPFGSYLCLSPHLARMGEIFGLDKHIFALTFLAHMGVGVFLAHMGVGVLELDNFAFRSYGCWSLKKTRSASSSHVSFLFSFFPYQTKSFCRNKQNHAFRFLLFSFFMV